MLENQTNIYVLTTAGPLLNFLDLFFGWAFLCLETKKSGSMQMSMVTEPVCLIYLRRETL